MKRTFLLGLSAITIMFLAGCGPTAHIETSKNVNFNQYQTFAWADLKNRRGHPDLTEEKIKDAVSYELQKTTGWRENNRNPDVLLSYDVLVERGARVQSDPMYSWGGYRTFYNPYRRRFYNVYYPSMFMGYDNYAVPTKDGTITITMVDARTDKTILQAWATDEVDSRRLNASEVDRIVKAIFKKWNADLKYYSRNNYNERYHDRYNNDGY